MCCRLPSPARRLGQIELSVSYFKTYHLDALHLAQDTPLLFKQKKPDPHFSQARALVLSNQGHCAMGVRTNAARAIKGEFGAGLTIYHLLLI